MLTVCNTNTFVIHLLYIFSKKFNSILITPPLTYLSDDEQTTLSTSDDHPQSALQSSHLNMDGTSYGSYNTSHLTSDDLYPNQSPDDTNDGNDNQDDDEEAELIKFAKSKYDMKNHMANERTFFKYLFTGLHIGGIGTLVLSFFQSTDLQKLYLVLFIWIIAFSFMFWGLYSYYKRKYLMEKGHFKEIQLLNPHTPIIITAIFIFVIAMVIAYAITSDQIPDKGRSKNMNINLPANDQNVLQKVQSYLKNVNATHINSNPVTPDSKLRLSQLTKTSTPSAPNTRGVLISTQDENKDTTPQLDENSKLTTLQLLQTIESQKKKVASRGKDTVSNDTDSDSQEIIALQNILIESMANMIDSASNEVDEDIE